MTFCDCHRHHIVRRIPSGDTRERDICTKCGHVFYQNPTIVAGIIPMHGDQILLCRRAIEPKKNFWTVPSGFMEMNETVQEAALRECHEEAGITPHIDGLHTIYDLPHIGQVYMLFLGKCSSKEHVPGAETLESMWVTHATIPWDEMAFSSVTFGLKRLFDSNTPHFGACKK